MSSGLGLRTLLLWFAMVGSAVAQSNPGWVLGQVPTAQQWNDQWALKADAASPVITGLLNNTGTAQLGATTIVTPGTGGTGLLTVGAGGANHITLSAPLAGSRPAIATTGADGLTINGGTTGPLQLIPTFINGQNYAFSGPTSQEWLHYNTNLSGTYTGTADLNTIENSSDTVDNSINSDMAGLAVLRRFGGTGAKGSRLGLRVGLNLSGGITSDAANSGSAYIPIMSFVDASYNAGGTGLTAATSSGSAVAFYPQAWLHPGATNFTTVEGAEWDIAIEGTTQIVVVGTGHVAANVLTATFTSASIVGSPVAVTYTVGAGNMPVNIVNGLAAAISRNDALLNAGISANQAFATTDLQVSWPTQNTVAMVITTSGPGVLTPGSVVPGASARIRNGQTISRKNVDTAQGVLTDVAFRISDQSLSSRAGQWRTGILFGDGSWPIAKQGTIIGAAYQTSYKLGGVLTGPFSPNTAKYGIDWTLVNFSQATGASLNMPGAALSGTGVLSLKNATFTVDSTGLTVAVPGVVGSGNPAIVSGGGGGSGAASGNYFIGDIVFGVNGGQYVVATVNTSTGAVTALTTLVQPSDPTACAIGGATVGGSGSGLTITPTCAASNSLSLLPTAGSKIGLYNAVPVVRSAGYAPMTGTPNKPAVYDTASVTLAQLAGRVMQLQADLTALGVIGP